MQFFFKFAIVIDDDILFSFNWGDFVPDDDVAFELEIISDGTLKKSFSPLDAGNSGTTTRLLTGILAGQDFDSVIIGDESLSKRPMKSVGTDDK